MHHHAELISGVITKDPGEELSRHRLRIAPLVAMFVATVVGAFCLALLHPVVAALALIPLGLLVWMVVRRAGDVLTVHRDGFTFRHRGKTQQCRWDDIDQADIRLGGDRRGRIREVKKGSKTISFGAWMGGLDVLYYAYATEGGRKQLDGPQPTGEGIGAVVSTHGATTRRGWVPSAIFGGVFVLIAAVLLYGTLSLSRPTAQDLTYAIGCMAAALGLLALLLWLALQDRGDELRIHEHGFAYRHRGTVQDCRWDEIVNYEQRRLVIRAVMRQDGTWISLSANVPDTQTLIRPHLRIAQDTSPPRPRGRDLEWTEPDPE
jgi:hypothetical protein